MIGFAVFLRHDSYTFLALFELRLAIQLQFSIFFVGLIEYRRLCCILFWPWFALLYLYSREAKLRAYFSDSPWQLVQAFRCGDYR